MTDTTSHVPARVERAVTQEMIDRYADVSGDRNPLHIDQDYAQGTSFGRTIAHGQLLLALLSEAMLEECGEAWASSGELDVKFVSPVFSGDVVTVHLAPDGPRFDAELRVGDRVVVVGTACCEGA